MARFARKGKGHGRKRGQKVVPLPEGNFTVTIETLGAQGDGLGTAEGMLFFVPRSLPGDRLVVTAEARRSEGFSASIVEVLDLGPGHVTPPCPHYGDCGGCSLQHMEPDYYTSWKKEKLVTTLRRNGLDCAVGEPVMVPAGTRRRLSLSAARKGNRTFVGFNRRFSDQIVEISSCLLLVPALNALLAPLRAVLPSLLSENGTGDVIINYSDTGADVTFAFPGDLNRERLEALAEFSQAGDVAKIAWFAKGAPSSELVLRHRAPTMKFGRATVELPQGAFLQPSFEGEDALRRLTLKALEDVFGDRKNLNLLELFSGCGSFTFDLAEKGRVTAVEGNLAMTESMELAAGRADLGGRISVLCKDLSRQPLTSKELSKFDAVVFDPPRAGAREQMEELAHAEVSAAVAVSCNSATMVRDLKYLVDGGWTLSWVTPVDQFIYSPHLEAVALLRR